MPSDHLMKVLMDSVQPIAREMHERLDADLSEKDLTAVGTAITKSVVAGACAGMAEASAQVQEALPKARIHLHQEISEYDEWAERYGS